MNKKLSNDENIKNLKKRAILRRCIIGLLIVTLILSIISIFYNFLIIPTLIIYIVTRVLTSVREKVPINRKDELIDVRNELNKNKKMKK